MTFGDIMQSLREKAGLTQAGLAERSGIPLRTIQGWEQGYRSPVSPDFFKLVHALGVSADAFASVAKTESSPKPGRPPKATPGTPPAADLEAEGKQRHAAKGAGASKPPRTRKGK
jgi:transcriptional regulator with XRE-family HTH domain